MLAQQVLNNFRNEELEHSSDTFREIEFADPQNLKKMYYYKAEEEQNQL